MNDIRICPKCGTAIRPLYGVPCKGFLCSKCEYELLNTRAKKQESEEINGLYINQNDYMMQCIEDSKKIEDLISDMVREDLNAFIDDAISCNQSFALEQMRSMQLDCSGRLAIQNISMQIEKEENEMTRKYALITFKNGNNILCPVSENGNILRYDLAELITKGISDQKFRKEMKKTDYSLKRGMLREPVICPVCKGVITIVADKTPYRDDIYYYKCQKCGRRIEDIERDLANFLDGDLATISSVVEIDDDGTSTLKYSAKPEWRAMGITTLEWGRLSRETLNKISGKMEEVAKMYKNSIIEIKEIVPGKIYEYKFEDGDIQKTVCSESDQFSMEDSITIAYAKHFMGGSGRYNRAVDKAMKLFTNQKAAEEKAKKEAEAAKVRQEKKAKKKAERIARKREAEIELQAEAYRRAMQSIAEERSNRKFEKHKKPKEK